MVCRFFLVVSFVLLLHGCGGNSENSENAEALPDVSQFLTNKSDQFLVDISFVSDGHPHKGVNAVSPHGANVHFDDSDPQWATDNLSPSNFPAIYAVADGSIFGMTEWTQVGSNYRYGIDPAFAKKDGKIVIFQYSIEPMVDPGDSNFYKDFILVTENQEVDKGDVIAYMYIPSGENQGTHIHFGLNDEDYSQEMAPAILADSLVQSFHDTWDTFKSDGGTDMPACMGYMIGSAENPFGTGAQDCL